MHKERLGQIALVVLLIAIPLAVYFYMEETKLGTRLDIMGPTTENEQGETVYHTIDPFTWVNQMGDTVTDRDFDGKIYVANFFFASCPTVCPDMLTQMMRVQEEFGGAPHFLMISHTVDPRHDSVPVLRSYSQNYDADPRQWHFVTGERKRLYLHARNSYLIDNLEGDGGPTDFIHSQFVVLVAPNDHIRVYYDGTDPGEVDDLIEDIYSLEDEFGYSGE
jgi:protein SCO1/2